MQRDHDGEVWRVVTQTDEREQNLVDDHRKQHQVPVVGVEISVDSASSALQDEVPLVVEEGEMAACVEDQHRREKQ